MTRAPWKPLNLAPVEVDVEPLGGGALVLRSRRALGPYARSIGDLLRAAATAAPDRTFLAERSEPDEPGERAAESATAAGAAVPDGGWRRVSFGEALVLVERLAAALLHRGLGAERPLAILSENSIDNGLLQLAALHAGIPVAPISPAYSLLSRDFMRLRAIVEQVQPGLIYAADGARYGAALAAAAEATGAADRQPPPHLLVSRRSQKGALLASLLAEAAPGAAEAARFAAVGPDTIAKILFTSGSTGVPKGVITTQRMLCSNQEAIAQGWPFFAERPPVIVDWLPWSHTFGGSHNFNMVLRHQGTLYIDAGRPAPDGIETTVRNLREVSPTLYFNVPRGFEVLLPYLETDVELRRSFFAQLDAIFYAAAALPQQLWERLEAASTAATGQRVTMLSAWGSTETAPGATMVHSRIERAGVIGVPLAGTEIKLSPAGDKLDLRVRGPNVTPGYWRQPEASAAAFDEDGFLRTGDAGRLADPRDASRGLVFDGRIAENFKLSSGSWVHVGDLRALLLTAGAPLIQDVVPTGHDRESLGLLVFPNLAACREIGAPSGDAAATAGDLVRHRAVRAALREKLAAHNAAHPESSRRIAAALIQAEPPSIDAGEITDKGNLNQRAVLRHRAAQVERLHDGDDGDDMIRF